MATSVTIDETGIHAPSYDDVLTYVQTLYRGIYGSDIYIEADSQDGQFLAIVAQALHDNNSQAVAVYNAFSPSTAQGLGLSRVVKINGISRKVATNSTVDVLLGGNAGTVITDGVVKDDDGNSWDLPSTVTIPAAGQITVTATAQTAGDIRAAVGTVNSISTATRGWHSVTNLVEAEAGDAVETDSTLRQRQKKSTALPSQTLNDGLEGAIASISGVTFVKVYENDTNSTDDNGIPAHSICAVVDGGDVDDIALVIANKKTPGTGTYGDTTVDVSPADAVPVKIKLQRPEDVPISVVIELTALDGYTTVIQEQIQTAIAEYINSISIGGDIYYRKLYVPAQLSNATDSATYDITSIKVSRDLDTPTEANITLAFNENPSCTTSLVYITAE